MSGRPRPSSAALKLLERTKASTSDWSSGHYRRLLTGFGFVSREGTKHTVYVDPANSENFVIVPRHGRIRSYIADEAIKAIERALAAEEEK
jgi:hypothetical protein